MALGQCSSTRKADPLKFVPLDAGFDGDAVLEQLCSDLVGQLQTVKDVLAEFRLLELEGRDARWARRKLRVLRRFLLQAYDVTSVVGAFPASLLTDAELLPNAASLAAQLQIETREAIRVGEAFEKEHPAELPFDLAEISHAHLADALEGLVRLSTDAAATKEHLRMVIVGPQGLADDDVLDEVEADVEDAVWFVACVRELKHRWMITAPAKLHHGQLIDLDIMLTGVEADFAEVNALLPIARSRSEQAQISLMQKRMTSDSKKH